MSIKWYTGTISDVTPHLVYITPDKGQKLPADIGDTTAVYVPEEPLPESLKNSKGKRVRFCLLPRNKRVGGEEVAEICEI